MNQYNTDKLNWKKKIGNFEIKILDTRNLVTTTVLNKNVSEVKMNFVIMVNMLLHLNLIS